MHIYTKEIYSEVCEFLELLGNEYKRKITKILLKIFEKNKSEKYIPHINLNSSIKEQDLKEDTLAIIAILNLKYWCDNGNEVNKLKNIYTENERKYQEKLSIKISSDNIFRNNFNEDNCKEIIEYKPFPFYKKFINKIKEFFIKNGII